MWLRLWGVVLFCWNRIGDFCTLRDLLDMLGWKTVGITVLAMFISPILIAGQEIAIWKLFLISLSSGLLVVGIVLGFQIRNLNKSLRSKSPFTIEFDKPGERYYERIKEFHNVPGWRTVWWIKVRHNAVGKTLQNVKACIDGIYPEPEQIPDIDVVPKDHKTVLRSLQRLKFGNAGSAESITLSYGEPVTLNFASYADIDMEENEIRLEGSNQRFFARNGLEYVLSINIVADDVANKIVKMGVMRQDHEMVVRLIED